VITTILIWVPIAAAVVVWVLPLSRYATGSLAVLVSLAEVGIWIEQAFRFDFSKHGLQFEQRAGNGHVGTKTLDASTPAPAGSVK